MIPRDENSEDLEPRAATPEGGPGKPTKKARLKARKLGLKIKARRGPNKDRQRQLEDHAKIIEEHVLEEELPKEVPETWVPSDSPPKTHHLEGHIALLVALTTNADMGVTSLDEVTDQMTTQDGETLCKNGDELLTLRESPPAHSKTATLAKSSKYRRLGASCSSLGAIIGPS